MAKMKSAVMIAPGRVELEEVDRPEPGPDTVLVKTDSVGICGSNLHWWRGSKPAEGFWAFPVHGAGGHEYGGVVVDVGTNIRSGIKVGDRVAIDLFHAASCGNCKYCAIGAFSHCLDTGQFETGGFTEFLKLPDKGLYVLPESVETHWASIIEPAATSVSALRRLKFDGGETVLVIGAGVLGLAAAGVSKALGAGKVVISAKYDVQAMMAYKLDADVVLRSDEENFVEKAIEAVGGNGADIVVETVGGHAPTLSQATDMVRPRGTVVSLGLWDEPVSIDSWKAAFKEITYNFRLAYGQTGLVTDYQYTLDLMASGKVPLEKLITHELPLEKIQDAFELASDKSRGAIKVIVRI